MTIKPIQKDYWTEFVKLRPPTSTIPAHDSIKEKHYLEFPVKDRSIHFTVFMNTRVREIGLGLVLEDNARRDEQHAWLKRHRAIWNGHWDSRCVGRRGREPTA